MQIRIRAPADAQANFSMDMGFRAWIGGLKHQYGVPNVDRRIKAWICGSKRGCAVPSVDRQIKA